MIYGVDHFHQEQYSGCFLSHLTENTWLVINEKANVIQLCMPGGHLATALEILSPTYFAEDTSMLTRESYNCNCMSIAWNDTGLDYRTVPRSGELCYCCCLPLLPQLTCSILATWERPYRDSPFRVLWFQFWVGSESVFETDPKSRIWSRFHHRADSSIGISSIVWKCWINNFISPVLETIYHYFSQIILKFAKYGVKQ